MSFTMNSGHTCDLIDVTVLQFVHMTFGFLFNLLDFRSRTVITLVFQLIVSMYIVPVLLLICV